MSNNAGINSVVQDHRKLSTWSFVGNETSDLTLPIDMRYNSGHQLSIIVYSILMVISSVGNITVLVILIRKRLTRSSRIDVMLTHLAIADLMVTFIMMPLEIGWAYTVDWRANDLVCRVMAFFRVFGLYLSSFILVTISIDRYYAVLKPLNLSDRRGKIMIMVAWISSFVCSTPQAVIFHVEKHPNITWYEQCVTYNFFKNETQEVIYSFVGMILIYALPLIIIIYSYGSIYLEIFRKSRMQNTDSFRRSSISVLGRAKRKTIKLSCVFVLVFLITWTPYYVMCCWYWFHRSSASLVDQRIQKGLFLFACANSCMNPIVYLSFNNSSQREKSNKTCNITFKKKATNISDPVTVQLDTELQLGDTV